MPFFPALEVQLSATEREHIPAGVRIHVIKGSRGSYIRTPDGKFFAIRQPPSIPSENGSKPSRMTPPSLPPSLPTNPMNRYLLSKCSN